MRRIGRDIADRLVATGVSILGEVSALVLDDPLPEKAEPGDSAGPLHIDPQIAALLVAGLYRPAADAVAAAKERVDELEADRQGRLRRSLTSATQALHRRLSRR
jgi:hypothetical protein